MVGLRTKRVFQIYVERYPQLGSRQPISNTGGVRPTGSRDGRELFFSSPDGRQMFAVKPGQSLSAGRPQPLFEFPMIRPSTGNRPYDVTADGRFVMIRTGSDGDASTNMILVQHWFDELRRLVPVN